MSERFYVEHYVTEWREGWQLVDRQTGDVVGQDGGEPEDQLLVRDWKWVPEALNRMAASEAALKAELEKAKDDKSFWVSAAHEAEKERDDTKSRLAEVLDVAQDALHSLENAEALDEWCRGSLELLRTTLFAPKVAP